MCLGSGALLDFAVTPYEGKETGEQTLLRKLLFHLRAGDILLGDANFENYFLLALVLQAQADVVFEKNGSRIIDFSQTLLGASGDWLEEKIANMLEIIGQHVVGNRPGRSEPRAVKKRPKPHKRLQRPRSQARRLKQYQGKKA